jgi:hypothetical protein
VIKDHRFSLLPDDRDDLNLPAERLDLLASDVLDHGQLPPCTDDAAALVESVVEQADERLPRKMPDGLAGVLSAHDKEEDVRVGKDVPDDTFDAEVLGV